ncbi:MAG: phosphomannomutase/phosphoglucomutase [Gammaproteobacteria bacterium]|nr:phosphomannomutase/phosphoglucomutase [Gammaproteobacteria bacterium]
MDVNSSIFRAYDIRGVVKTDLRPDVVLLIGKAIGTLYPQCKKVAIGRDGRLTSKELADNLIKGLSSTGIDVIDIGEVPTPVLYYATHSLGTGSGLMVTGSHNPPEYNGIKMVMGEKTLFGDMIQDIYACIEKGTFNNGNGNVHQVDVLEDYLATICKEVKLKRSLSIAIDCGNGVAGPSAINLFNSLGCNVSELFCDVDGNFPNHHPNPSEPENLQDLISTVINKKLDLGLAFDGDGDRVGIVDEHGEVLWADRQMMLYAQDVLSRNPGAEIIFDVKSSRNLASYIEQAGGKATMWKTGHSFIKNKMKETGALLAGEMSGHIFFKERWFGFDDGLYSAARMLEILAADSRPVSEIFSQLPNDVSTPEITVTLDRDGAQHEFIKKFIDQSNFTDAKLSTIDGVRADFDYGWGLVRASNTTPSLVIRFEAESEQKLEQLKDNFKSQIHSVDSTINLPF